MLRKERVFITLEELARNCPKDESGIPLGVSAGDIAQHLSLLRNNCSADLKQLQREGRVTCIVGRPTLYLPKQWLEMQFSGGTALLASSYVGVSDYIKAMTAHRFFGRKITQDEVFESAMGSQQSLQAAMDRAKMALQYPPYGMHVLLLGQTGVGKSTFARAMYSYAVENGFIKSGVAFSAFNCAEYANNQEILLDHLFGHVKGAFTGALRDKPGLVEYTDGGILFLDEVHRLPPEGQEMLFHLLDYGEFRRLGESDSFRKSRIRLFAATTEAPESSLLSTFLRRIPMTIRLPALRDWSIHDRHELIFRLLLDEAKETGRSLRLTADALDFLLRTQFSANIGGLKNALKLACANAFLHEVNHHEVTITRQYVSLSLGDSLYIDKPLLDTLQDLVVEPTSTPVKGIWNPHDASLVDNLSRLQISLSELSFSPSEIVDALGREVHRRMAKRSGNHVANDLRAYVGVDFYDGMQLAWANLDDVLSDRATQRSWSNIVLYLYGEVHRTFTQNMASEPAWIKDVMDELPDLYKAAKMFLLHLHKELNVPISPETISVVTLLFQDDTTKPRTKIHVLVALFGDLIASSMVNVAVHLAGGEGAITALEIPLEFNESWLQTACDTVISSMENDWSLLILTDVPAIIAWHDAKQEEGSSYAMRLVFRPDLFTVLRALYIVQSGSQTMDQMATWLQGSLSNRSVIPSIVKKRIIWACSLTGRGTASAISRLIEQALPEAMRDCITVISRELGGGREVFFDQEEQPVAVVGSVRPPLVGVPFFAVEELLDDTGMQRFLQVVGFGGYTQSFFMEQPDSLDHVSESIDILRDHVKKILERDLIFLNPAVVMVAVQEMMTYLRDDLSHSFSSQWEARFCLHMAYAMERVVKKETVVYPYLQRIQRIFSTEWVQLLGVSQIIEHYLGVQPNDNEIAYLFEMIFPDRALEMFQ